MFRRNARWLGLALVLAAVAGSSPALAARVKVARIQDMHFGTITRDAGRSGWIQLSPAGALTEGGALIFLGGTVGAAEFEVTGDPDALFRISLPHRIKLGRGVKVKDLVSDPADMGRLGPDGRAIVRVGGTLKLSERSTAGALSAMFRLMVHYL